MGWVPRKILERCVRGQLLAAAAFAVGSTCAAQESSRTSGHAELPPAFVKWWSALTDGRDKGPSIDGCGFHYRLELLYVPPAAELNQLRQAVIDHPEHPQRPILSGYERRLRHEDHVDKQVWRMGGYWRLSQSWDNRPDLPYWDFVWGKDGPWQLTSERLRLLSTDTSNKDGQAHIRRSSEISFETSLLLNSGLTIAAGNGLVLEPSLVGPDRWVLTARSASSTPPKSFTAHGTWDSIRGFGTVDEAEFRREATDSVPADSEKYVSRSWTVSDLVGRPVASEVTVFRRDGAPDRRLTLVSITPFTAREFDALTRQPTITSTDAVRGRVGYRSVLDETGRSVRVAEVTGGVMQWDTAQSSGEVSRAAPLRIAGWMAAGLLLLTLVVIRLRRRIA
jgi:hypothetical protein